MRLVHNETQKPVKATSQDQSNDVMVNLSQGMPDMFQNKMGREGKHRNKKAKVIPVPDQKGAEEGGTKL